MCAKRVCPETMPTLRIDVLRYYKSSYKTAVMIFSILISLPVLLGNVINSVDVEACLLNRTDKYLHMKYKSEVCRVGKDFDEWRFSAYSTFKLRFPIDSEKQNYVRKISGALFSEVKPTALSNVKLVAVSNKALLDILDLNPAVQHNFMFVNFVAGNWLHPGGVYLSHRYGGHQFGYWAGQLGDGRAILLGEYINLNGEKWELQLKGSGKTPYSRNGDGRAVLRSSVREFLVSEAMYHLDIPTTRVASLVVSDDTTWRDQFYDGHPKREKTAVVLRLSKSWFRIGSLEILHYSKEYRLLRQLVEFIIEDYFPWILKKGNRFLIFFRAVVEMTADLIAKWQAFGFAHGVCNTDNFSVLSITMDYGPFGFMDTYNPGYIPNTSDDEGRYSFQNQPQVGYFNLEKLMVALSSLMFYESAKVILDSYQHVFEERYMFYMRKKLGLFNKENEDKALLQNLLEIMSLARADYTMTFRELSEITVKDLQLSNYPKAFWSLPKLGKATYDLWVTWVDLYIKRLKRNKDGISDVTRISDMQDSNPRYILRNYMAEKAIELANEGDFSEVKELLLTLQNPFKYQLTAESKEYASPLPKWAKKLRISCSS